MTTQNILDTFRNAEKHATKLASWQSQPLAKRLKALKAEIACQYSTPKTLAEAFKAKISRNCPELSSPEVKNPLLWVSDNSPEVLEYYQGRAFLEHQGWFTDDDCQDETLETYAIQLARFPHLLFYAVKDSCNGDFRVSLNNWEEINYSEAESDYDSSDATSDCAKEVVRCNDSSTQYEAEESREYYRKYRVEQDIAKNRETLSGLRTEIRELCHELKELCPSTIARNFPTAASACRNALSALLSERRELMESNEELAASI